MRRHGSFPCTVWVAGLGPWPKAKPVAHGTVFGATAHCQCNDCRRSGGSGHCSHLGVPKPAVSVTGAVTMYESAADSGNMVGRGFCPTCGAAVYSVNSGMTDLNFLRASSLDDPEVFQPQMVVYTARGSSWDRIDPDLPAFEGMPPGTASPDG